MSFYYDKVEPKRLVCKNTECKKVFHATHNKKYCSNACAVTVANRRRGHKKLKPYTTICPVTGFELPFWAAPDHLYYSRQSSEIEPVQLTRKTINHFRASTIGRRH